MNSETNADFCLEIEFEKGSESPERVFRAMTDLIETFQQFDTDLATSIDVKLEPILLLEDIESGSIKTWLRTQLESVDDEALKDFNWKRIVGRYLVKAKYLIVDFLKDKTQITDRKEVQALESRIFELAKETDVRRIPAYAPIALPKLFSDFEKLTSSLSHLRESDKANYITADGKVPFNLLFQIAPEAIEDLITKEAIVSKSEMILKVKKPDYLGESMWEFKHETRAFPAKILDLEWLQTFQSREIDVRPGDSLRAQVETEVKYGYDGDVIATHHKVLKVLKVLQYRPLDQTNLFAPDND